MSFMAHELTENSEVQQKLFEEIQAMHEDMDGKMISYENIQSLKYMDQVLCETLRKWPSVPVRIFNSDFYFKSRTQCFRERIAFA